MSKDATYSSPIEINSPFFIISSKDNGIPIVPYIEMPKEMIEDKTEIEQLDLFGEKR